MRNICHDAAVQCASSCVSTLVVSRRNITHAEFSTEMSTSETYRGELLVDEVPVDELAEEVDDVVGPAHDSTRERINQVLETNTMILLPISLYR